MAETSTETQISFPSVKKGVEGIKNLLKGRQGHADWNKTELAQERLKERGLYEEPDRESKTGYYLRRPIIGRDTPINGGIYVGGGEREAILVDDSFEKSKLHDVYDELIQVRSEDVKRGRHFKEGLLTDVFELVQKRLPYRPDIVRQLAIKNKIKPDQKVSLTAYLKAGGGVCRHQALLVAYLLERAGKEGKVSGKVSIDRNFVPGVGGHAWIRYTNSIGDVIVIDPARQITATLDELPDEIRKLYERPKGVIKRLLKR